MKPAVINPETPKGDSQADWVIDPDGDPCDDITELTEIAVVDCEDDPHDSWAWPPGG